MARNSKASQKWLDALAKALNDWLAHNGYGPGGDNTFVGFAEKLKIPFRNLRSIRSAENIVRDVSVYAKIYVFTGLDEADPRKIPSNTFRKARGSGTYTRQYAWTERQLNRWLEKQNFADMVNNVPTDVDPVPEPEPVTDEIPHVDADLRMNNRIYQETLGLTVDSMFSLFFTQQVEPMLKLAIRQQLRGFFGNIDLLARLERIEAAIAKLEPTQEQEQAVQLPLDMQVAEAMQQLTTVLSQAFRSNDPALWQVIYENHGEPLGDLWLILEPFSKGDFESMVNAWNDSLFSNKLLGGS